MTACSTLPYDGVRVGWSLEEEGGRTHVDRYPDRQDEMSTRDQIALRGRETYPTNVGKSDPMEGSLIASFGEYPRLADKDGSSSTAVQVSNNAHR